MGPATQKAPGEVKCREFDCIYSKAVAGWMLGFRGAPRHQDTAPGGKAQSEM